MKKICLFVFALGLSFAVFAGSNPFARYDKKIKDMEAQIEKAKGKSKDSLEKKLDKLKEQKSKAVEKAKAPYEKKISSLEKSMGKAKGKKKASLEKQISALKAKVQAIDKMANPPEKTKK
jgi:F0F1-type ATP synthase membrane subunit b/b'